MYPVERNIDKLTDMLQRRLFVELEASGRHVHLTEEQTIQLFGHGLTEQRPLSQPGQYLAKERVSLQGPKGKLDHVAVLGPCRKAAQVELSVTDALGLGIQAPVRLSGDTEGSAAVILTGERGTVSLREGVVIAKRHIHMTPEDASLQKIRDGDVVRLKTLTDRPVVFEEVSVRVSPSFQTYAHLDFDEANACGFRKGDLGMIVP